MKREILRRARGESQWKREKEVAGGALKVVEFVRDPALNTLIRSWCGWRNGLNHPIFLLRIKPSLALKRAAPDVLGSERR
jgi:hypothetical protein